MHCSSCNSDNPEGQKFCGECGSPLVRRCASCGVENPSRFKFCGECGVSLVVSSQLSVLSSQPSFPHPQHPTPSTQSAGERRQLTVMFCDLVDSTALSERLDPEEYREVVQAYQQTSATVIERFDGHIAQYLGDGLLVYFGYPVAHEDDAVRAVRTGLGIISAIQEQVPSPSQETAGEIPPVPLFSKGGIGKPPLEKGAARSAGGFGSVEGGRKLQLRIGIHTGLVVVGEIGSSEKRELLAMGETPNIAARVQGQAHPDEVIMSATTYRLVEGLFACEDRGQPALKGVSTPLTLYRVCGESEAQSRFHVVVRKGLTPLIGRDHEYGLLQERWARVKEGEGQIVLLSGEPGIGKSRLVEALKEYVTHEGARCLELRCSPYAQNSALQPIVEHLQRTWQFRPEDSADEKRQKLVQAVKQRSGAPGGLERSSEDVIASAAKQSLSEKEIASSPSAPRNDTTRLQEVVPLFATLLSLPHPEGYPPLALSPQRQKEKTYEAIVTWLCAEASEHPIVYAWEDLHWADPSTLDLLTLFLAQVPTRQMLVVLTFRPEFTPSWGTHSYLSQLTLSRLGRSHVEIMVEKVTGGKILPQEVIQQIVSKTDGVPLFIEELTKSVVESVGAQHAAPLPLAIPATLQDSLMARLDRLGPTKEIAQLGATIGREFNYDLLQAVSLLNEEALQRGLQQLVESELVYQSGMPPQARYLFKHALVQDTAYQSLLKRARQKYHQQIATTLETQFPQTVETQPELVAHHYTEADLAEQAIPYWQRAGQSAAQRSANVEAISHLTKALELLNTLPDTNERTQQELTLQITLGVPLMATKGLAAPEVERIYVRAQELCQQVGKTPQLFPVLYGLCGSYTMRAKLVAARELGEQLLSLAWSIQDPSPLIAARFALGQALFWLGEFALAREHVEHGVALYNSEQHRLLAFLYGQDPGVTCRLTSVLALWHLGYPDQAQKRLREALTLGQGLSHSYSLALVSLYAGILHQFRQEEQVTQRRVETVRAFSSEQGFSFLLARATILRGWALAMQGEAEEGIVQIRQGMAALRTIGVEGGQSHFLALLAEAYGKRGQTKEGLTVLAEALDFVSQTEERFYEAELYRLYGELSLRQGERETGRKGEEEQITRSIVHPIAHSSPEECFLKAIEIARKQQAKSLELRAVMSLVRLRQQQVTQATIHNTQHETRTKLDEAHRMLSEVYNWFTEGFDTKDLQEAKVLIEELTH